MNTPWDGSQERRGFNTKGKRRNRRPPRGKETLPKKKGAWGGEEGFARTKFEGSGKNGGWGEKK